MFTREELALNFHSPGPLDEMPVIEVRMLRSRQFDFCRVGEFVAHRGMKTEFSSPLEFWLWSFHLFVGESWVCYLEEDVVCEPISEEQFFRQVDDLAAGLTRPLDFPHRKNFVTAMHVYCGIIRDGFCFSSMAEFDDAFVALYEIIED